MQSASFLSEFPPIKTEQWENAVREGVSGQDYAEKLIWRPEEGLAVKPYYRAEDIEGLPFLDADPGQFPYVRGTSNTPGWRIREYVRIADPEEANRKARELIAAGADEIAFIQPAIQTSSDVALLLADLGVPFHFEGLVQDAVRMISHRLQKNPYPALISCDLDPLADLDFAAELLQTPQSMFRPFTIAAERFHERGAGGIEEIGFTLSAAADLLAQMQERNISADRAAQSILFSFAIGPEFYIQIAKLRAFRMLWSQVVTAFGGDPAASKPIVHARPACWNKTIYDPHINILRTTTETISAILGNADSMSVFPFDSCYRESNENSTRLARNTQLILRHEAHLAKVADAVGGSYLIEAITNAIASKAWTRFQELESAGGFLKVREAGVVSSVLDVRERSRQDSVNRRHLVLTGTNRFADASDVAYERIDPVCCKASKRAASAFEAIRLRTEGAIRAGKSPQIELAEIGDARMRTARSGFVADFLSCAGLTSNVRVFGNPLEIASSHADALVLCSSDPEYLSIAAELMSRIMESGTPKCVFIAGNPDGKEQLKALGVTGFIHVGCDAVAVLSKLQRQIGIGD